MATTQTTTQNTYTRKQGRLTKVWHGSFDIIDSAFTTTHAVVTNGGQAVANTAKLINTIVSGGSELGIIMMNSVIDEMIVDAVISSLHGEKEVAEALNASGLTQAQFDEVKARLLRGTLNA